MESRLRHLWLALLVTVSVQLTRSQQGETPARVSVGSCSQVVLSDFGNTTSFSSRGILPVVFITGDGTTPPMLMVTRFKLLCDVIGTTRDSSTSISALVEFKRPSKDTPNLAQVTVDCQTYQSTTGETLSSFYPPAPSGSSGTALDTTTVSRGDKLRQDPVATFDTPTSLNCGRCVDPIVGVKVDSSTHCLPCLGECTGMKRCTDTMTNHCCNLFNDDRCVGTCTEPLVGDPETFICGCSSLKDVVANSVPLYTNRFLLGSLASFQCNNGYYLVNPEVVKCTLTGWLGNLPSCELIDCGTSDIISGPDNGLVSFTTTTFGSLAVFSCNANFMLQGQPVRTCDVNGWSGSNPTCEIQTSPIECVNCNGGTCDAGICVSCPSQVVETAGPACVNGIPPDARTGGCGTPCIIGIALAAIGTIILVATVSGVAFGIYNYLNHPDTKMAKYDADNINGVARDNPLYVDPEAVVGDGAEAA